MSDDPVLSPGYAEGYDDGYDDGCADALGRVNESAVSPVDIIIVILLFVSLLLSVSLVLNAIGPIR